ncbi:hypothetical protein GCK72_001374 [Caenorhabditis remanei]|uniref:Uncharacterized protein n=1 Tax=Caenorhabditis remanei TaxID=31234 RepID=E3MFM1_CAERE|nr:hypothetical protein GCK72_001374 [Caenorhabditis remanei]EFP00980.1 hypothetical protein CRE_20724 [Caenorhabditis remanei]KAF1769557.1 hypothetical protein GCK72_001374 [Caenorhabditis remanei]
MKEEVPRDHHNITSLIYPDHNMRCHSTNDDDRLNKDVKFGVLRIFWGEMELPFTEEIELRAVKRSVEMKTFMSWEFRLGPPEDQKVLVSVPAHLFWRMLRTKKEELKMYPATFMFQLAQEGMEHLKTSIPDVYESVKKYHKERRKPLSELLFVVLDPANIQFFELGLLLYRGAYEVLIRQFHKVFDKHWADHNKWCMTRYPDPRVVYAPIEEVSGDDFSHLTKRFGLRNYDTRESADGIRYTVRTYLPRKEVKKKYKKGAHMKKTMNQREDGGVERREDAGGHDQEEILGNRQMSFDRKIVYPENLTDFFEEMRRKKQMQNRKNRLLKEIEDRIVKVKEPKIVVEVEEELIEVKEEPKDEAMEGPEEKTVEEDVSEEVELDFGMEEEEEEEEEEIEEADDGSFETDAPTTSTRSAKSRQVRRRAPGSAAPSTSLTLDNRPRRQRNEPTEIYKATPIKMRTSKRR